MKWNEIRVKSLASYRPGRQYIGNKQQMLQFRKGLVLKDGKETKFSVPVVFALINFPHSFLFQYCIKSELYVSREFFISIRHLYPLIHAQWKSLATTTLGDRVPRARSWPGQHLSPLGRKQSSCSAQVHCEWIQGGFICFHHFWVQLKSHKIQR